MNGRNRLSMFHNDSRQNAPFFIQHIQRTRGDILGAFFGFGFDCRLNRAKSHEFLRLYNGKNGKRTTRFGGPACGKPHSNFGLFSPVSNGQIGAHHGVLPDFENECGQVAPIQRLAQAAAQR